MSSSASRPVGDVGDGSGRRKSPESVRGAGRRRPGTRRTIHSATRAGSAASSTRQRASCGSTDANANGHCSSARSAARRSAPLPAILEVEVNGDSDDGATSTVGARSIRAKRFGNTQTQTIKSERIIFCVFSGVCSYRHIV